MIELDFTRKLYTVGDAMDDRYLLAMKAIMATLTNLRRRGQFLGFPSSSLENSMIWAWLDVDCKILLLEAHLRFILLAVCLAILEQRRPFI